MSKIAFQSQEDGTGTFTIAAPVGNTNRTLTIPDSSGTLITTAGAAMSGPLSNFTSTGIVDNATATSLTIDSAGRVLMPSQPAFFAVRTSHVTSSGTIIFDSEPFDDGGGYNNTNGVFTAPVSGRYLFTFSTLLFNLGSASSVVLRVNNVSYGGMSAFGVYGQFTGSYAGQGASAVVKLVAGDSVSMYFSLSGSTSLHSNYTWWSGNLIG